MDVSEAERVAAALESISDVTCPHMADERVRYQCSRGSCVCIEHSYAIREQAAALLRSLAANDRRYRWLVANKLRHNGSAWHWQPGEPLWDESLDAAIDTAMAKGEP